MVLMEKIKQIAHVDKGRVSRAIPVVSGATTLYMINKIIFSNLEFSKYLTSMSALIIIFILSAILYAYLTKLEKEKDTKFIDSTTTIVEHVFADYGVRVAAGTQPELVSADKMNTIMQTVVNYAKEMSDLSAKKL